MLAQSDFFIFGTSDQISQLVSGLSIIFVQDMRVDFEQHRRIGVTQALDTGLDVDASLQHQRCCRVAQGMKGTALRQVRGLTHGRPMATSKIVGMDERPKGIGQDEPVGVPKLVA